MPCLPPHPDLDQLRRKAKDLLRTVQRGDTDAVVRLHAVSGHLILDSAQLAVAREYGFASWARLKTEVDRRAILDTREATRLNALLAEHPELAVEPMLHWCDQPQGASRWATSPCCATTLRGAAGETCPAPELSPERCSTRERPRMVIPPMPRHR